jgi:acyl-CoA synthetase (AMP-forming)/AMP-acid ligase II
MQLPELLSNLLVHLDAATSANPGDSTPEGLRHHDALIMFTGGTTGLPKMVPWTHGNIAGSVRDIIAGYRLDLGRCTAVPTIH